MICFGLGYATLNRYDPRTAGITDSIAYYDLVAHGPNAGLGHTQFRVLVPFLARPFARLAAGLVGTWNPVFFGLLMANSLLVATTALLLVSLAQRQVGSMAVALLAAALYLLNFDVPNLRLAGLIDAGEGCFLMLLVCALFEERWWLLPLWGALGVLAKETFVPYSVILASTWWMVSSRRHVARFSRAVWVIVMVAAEFATLMILQASLAGHLIWPWQFAATLSGGPGYIRRFFILLADRQSWFDFIWLLPLGAWQLKRLARPWVVACGVTLLCPLVLSAYYDAQPGTWGRGAFSIAGPLLSLSAAMLVSKPASEAAVSGRS